MVRERGTSIVELLVAMGIALSIMASALAMVSRMQLGAASEGERVDMQQRARVASDALHKDLVMAGAGAYQGAQAGPLGFFVASVFPFRQGALDPDPAATFKTDTITVIFVPPTTAVQTTLRQPMPAQSGTVSINLDPGCPTGDAACGFVADMDLMIYDETGSYDTFRVLSVQPGALHVQHSMADSPHVYPSGSSIVEASSHTYYLKADAATDTYQLMHYDGAESEAAVIDHAIGLAFEYYGDPSPPALVRPVTDPEGPWTTYGPRPPALGVRTTQYPAGENCVFQLDATGLDQVPRLQPLGSGAATTLVGLTAAQFTDGPWCPDAASPTRYDADLLRIRKVAVTLRLETPQTALRGPAGALFSRGGTSHDANRWVPDHEMRFEVAPRNLGLGR